MPRSIISFDYSEANILGWLAAQEESLPTYAQLLQVAALDTPDVRKQALQRWGLFNKLAEREDNWATLLIDDQLTNLQEALPTRYHLDNHSYITDYVWLQRWMTRIRHIARQSFLQKDSQSDHEFLVTFFERVLVEVPVAEDVQSMFFLAFENALQGELSLLSLESALDTVFLLIQIQHYDRVSSAGIKQWILLQAVLMWIRQYTRAVSLGNPEPIWEAWFPPELVPNEFEDFEKLKDTLWRSLTGGSEWSIAAILEMLQPEQALTIDSVELEQQMRGILSQFLNESLYTQDVFMQIMRYAFQIRLIIETAAVITAQSKPNVEAVKRATCDYDL